MKLKTKESPLGRKTLEALVLIIAWVAGFWLVYSRLAQVEKIRCQSPGLNWQICAEVLAKRGGGQ